MYIAQPVISKLIEPFFTTSIAYCHCILSYYQNKMFKCIAVTFFLLILGDEGKFVIDEKLGIVTSSALSTDREAKHLYNVTFNVTDNGNPMLWVRIICLNSSHSFSIYENSDIWLILAE